VRPRPGHELDVEAVAGAQVQGRDILKLKAKFKPGSSHFGIKWTGTGTKSAVNLNLHPTKAQPAVGGEGGGQLRHARRQDGAAQRQHVEGRQCAGHA